MCTQAVIRYLFLLFLTLVKTFIAGNSEQNEIGTFWHITDFHVNTTYIIKNTTGYFGDYGRDTSTLVAFTGIEFANDMGYAENKPDFVVWGGDAAPHDQRQTKEDVLESLRFLSQHLRYAFDPTEVPLIPIIGNYDVFPSNTMSPLTESRQRASWCTRLSIDENLWFAWNEYIKEMREIHPDIPSFDFSTNCYQALIVQQDPLLVVIGLNSLVWYENNPQANESISDPLGQLSWLRRTLNAVRGIKAKAIVATHIPIGVHELNAENSVYLKCSYNEQLTQLLREYADVIITTLASHLHTDTFRVVLDEDYNPVGTLFLGPSVDPFYMKGIGSFNPRLRQFHYNRKTGVLLDYTQYYLNLSERAPTWQKEYQAREEYGIRNLTAPSMADLLDEFTVENDKDGHWGKYWKHHLGGRPHDPVQYFENGECPEAQSVCRCQQVCAMRHSEFTELTQCLSVCNSQPKPIQKTIKQLIHDRLNPSAGNKMTSITDLALYGYFVLAMLLWMSV
ncbi:unnamed protein product [Dicrocoelium dendriticum]|nr:unnamed protein product [Dicrocoelium dendriticum]